MQFIQPNTFTVCLAKCNLFVKLDAREARSNSNGRTIKMRHSRSFQKMLVIFVV